MHMISMMLDLNPEEIRGLMILCQQGNRTRLAELCGSPEEASVLMSALDEITWQLASCGHEGAIDALSNLDGDPDFPMA